MPEQTEDKKLVDRLFFTHPQPDVQLLLGPPGYGKTHMLGQIKKGLLEGGHDYVLIDFETIGLHDRGYIASRPYFTEETKDRYRRSHPSGGNRDVFTYLHNREYRAFTLFGENLDLFTDQKKTQRMLLNEMQRGKTAVLFDHFELFYLHALGEEGYGLYYQEKVDTMMKDLEMLVANNASVLIAMQTESAYHHQLCCRPEGYSCEPDQLHPLFRNAQIVTLDTPGNAHETFKRMMRREDMLLSEYWLPESIEKDLLLMHLAQEQGVLGRQYTREQVDQLYAGPGILL